MKGLFLYHDLFLHTLWRLTNFCLSSNFGTLSMQCSSTYILLHSVLKQLKTMILCAIIRPYFLFFYFVLLFILGVNDDCQLGVTSKPKMSRKTSIWLLVGRGFLTLMFMIVAKWNFVFCLLYFQWKITNKAFFSSTSTLWPSQSTF